MSQDASNLIWIDLEMTGLDTQTDVIIEIATIVTDSELNILAEGPMLAIHQSDEVMAGMDDWNTKQHCGSGLTERVKNSNITEAEAEAEKQRLERIGIAQGEAESITLRAKADAGATLLRAKAQAEANQLIAKSLTASVINWQAVNQWNGRYPTVVSSGGGEQLILPGDLFNSAETP